MCAHNLNVNHHSCLLTDDLISFFIFFLPSFPCKSFEKTGVVSKRTSKMATQCDATRQRHVKSWMHSQHERIQLHRAWPTYAKQQRVGRDDTESFARARRDASDELHGALLREFSPRVIRENHTYTCFTVLANGVEKSIPTTTHKSFDG